VVDACHSLEAIHNIERTADLRGGNPVWGKQPRRRHRLLTSQTQAEVNHLAAGDQVEVPGRGEPFIAPAELKAGFHAPTLSGPIGTPTQGRKAGDRLKTDG
jgi:hypothetical protein